MTKRFAFTLAEVLITLGIIGVVAAMTIPTLMNSTNQSEFKTGFKKIISTLNQAVTTNYALDNNDFTLLGSGTTTNDIYGMFNTRMNVVKTATTGLNGVAATNYTLYFNDGMEFSWAQGKANCSTATAAGWCAGIVDVNGDKKPNRLTNCNGDTTLTGVTPTEAAATVVCDSTKTSGAGAPVIGDRFSVRFGGQTVVPNGNGARYVLYN